jgi:hypothetical protein
MMMMMMMMMMMVVVVMMMMILPSPARLVVSGLVCSRASLLAIRQFLPVPTIKDLLLAMSINKLNTLHWHLVCVNARLCW